MDPFPQLRGDPALSALLGFLLCFLLLGLATFVLLA
jgi:hypothetical protein